MRKYYEERLTEISIRLTDYVTYFDPHKKKKELIKLLEKLIDLSKLIIKDFDELTQKVKDKKVGEFDVSNEINFYSYNFGRISVIKSIISSLIEKITDIENENQLTEEDKKIIEESKKNEEPNNKEYLG